MVASNGGVYVDELTQAGIKHFDVPLNTRNIGKMLQSLKLLKKIVREEKVDIVHSHARIPGICNRHPSPFHGLYICYKRPLGIQYRTRLKYLTNWGQKVIAVSEDIKQYLMDNYNNQKKRIFMLP